VFRESWGYYMLFRLELGWIVEFGGREQQGKACSVKGMGSWCMRHLYISYEGSSNLSVGFSLSSLGRRDSS